MQVRSLTWEDSLEEGNSLQYSCLENPMDRGAWQAAVHGVAQSQTLLKQLRTGASVVKNPPAHAGDVGSIPGSGRSPEEGNSNLLQYFCLENPRDRGAWQASVQGVAESDMT